MPHYIWQHDNWTNFRWDSDRLLTPLGECRLLQGKLLSTVAALGFSLESQAEILSEETVKTSAIEGEQLDARAVRSSVARRLGLPGAGIAADRSVDGLITVLLDATRNHSAPLTEERLCGWQAALFPTGYSGMHRIRTGEWRGDTPMQVISGPVGRETVHFEAPPFDRVPTEITNFLEWWSSSHGTVEGVIRAAVAHFRFVTIHPFEDGNGRLARALTDMALAQDDGQTMRYYSLSAQIMAERDDYYDILERCQKGDGELTEWLLWFLGCFQRAIVRSETLLSTVLDKAAFWRLHNRKALSERQKKVINRLLDAGKGGFEGGLTNRKYASLTDVSRATAFRELEALREMGVICQCGSGRSVRYELVWAEDGVEE
jgi:Fic family protein